MPSGHSLIPPSSAGRRVQCNGSAIMELMHPDTTDNEDAKEGTASHEIGERMVQSLAVGRAGFPKLEEVVGQAASNGVIWKEDSYEGALMYAEDVAEVMRSTAIFGSDNLRIEQRVHIQRIHEESWGTPDCSIWHTKGLRLYLWDYKFGRRLVEAFECYQMIEYAVGLIDEITGGNGLADQNIEIVMTIVQPRAYHREGPIRRWTVKASDLRGYANTLHAVEHAALGPNPTTCAGVECRDCSARHACETLQRGGMGAIAYLGQPTPTPLEGDALSLELRMLQEASTLIKSRLSGLETQAEGAIRNGQTVPGFALAPGQKREIWKSAAPEVIQLGDMMGVDLRKPETPCTPKQARDKGIDATVISQYSETPTGSLKLVSDGNKAREVFTK